MNQSSSEPAVNGPASRLVGKTAASAVMIPQLPSTKWGDPATEPAEGGRPAQPKRESRTAALVRLTSHFVAAAANQKIEVRALIRLLYVLDVQTRPAAGRQIQLGNAPRRASRDELRVADVQVQPALLDVDLDHVSVLHERERTACRSFRRDVQHRRAVRRPAP